MKRERRLAAAHEEHVLAYACAHGVERDERAACRCAIRRDGLQDQQLVAVQARVLHGRDH